MSKIITYMKTKISKLSRKQAYLQRLTPPSFQTQILILQSKERKIQTKPLQNLTKAGQGSKPTYFHSRGDKVVRFLEDADWWWWIIVIILVFLEHLFTKANANAIQTKPTTQFLRRTVTEESKLKTWKVLVIAWSCGHVDKWCGQNVSLPNSYPITFQGGGGEGSFQVWTLNHSIFFAVITPQLSQSLWRAFFSLSLSLSSLWGRR
jgi:hypothetical protein